jgi:membrane protease subunit (stomatin/prohibitin family)
MGIFDSAFDALGGTFADQWQDVITAGRFDEHSLVVHGVRRNSQNSRGSNHGAEDIISNGSLIYMPENTAAFIFSQAGIE